MLRRLAQIRGVHLTGAIRVLSREDELAILRPEQVANAVVALEELPRAARGEGRFPNVQMIATRGATATAPCSRLVGGAVRRCRATRRRLQLQVIQPFAVRQPAEA